MDLQHQEGGSHTIWHRVRYCTIVEANEGRMPHANRLEALARKHARQSPFKDPITITRNEDKEMDRNAIAAALEKLDFASTSGEAQRRSDQLKQEELRSPW
ncbi:hypothetical protein ACLKA6_017758 [Drosophila palustris]